MNSYEKNLVASLHLTDEWFRQSGVMLPSDGSWGVAERIMLSNGNEAMEKTMSSFPAWTPRGDHYVIEQRRADCCMEVAFLYLLMHHLFPEEKRYYETAVNLLDFLYFRSGLLNRTGKELLVGTWDWSHIKREHSIYFDDNSWMVALALKIARMHPELDAKYGMSDFALKLAALLNDAAPRFFSGEGKAKDEPFVWLGDMNLPHWGALVCLALSEAHRWEPQAAYGDFIMDYVRYMMEKKDSFTTSEMGYAVLGSVAAWKAFGNGEYRDCAISYADGILASMDPETGVIAAEHYEAPTGKSLVDTIYTMNWALLALQEMSKLDAKYCAAQEKILALLISIQDNAQAPHLHGCWRGMYDVEHQCWGGGDRFEGGANSIYTGWTNAPIAWGCAMELMHSSLSQF